MEGREGQEQGNPAPAQTSQRFLTEDSSGATVGQSLMIKGSHLLSNAPNYFDYFENIRSVRMA
jgi:hypothetical protein